MVRRGSAVVPQQLCKKLMEQYHGRPLGGHYSGNRLYNAVSGIALIACCRSLFFQEGERNGKQPLLYILFQYKGRSKYWDWTLQICQPQNKVTNIQDYFTKWPKVFPVLDQKTLRIVEFHFAVCSEAEEKEVVEVIESQGAGGLGGVQPPRFKILV